MISKKYTYNKKNILIDAVLKKNTYCKIFYYNYYESFLSKTKASIMYITICLQLFING